MNYGPPPESDQVELSVWGPGAGECCTVHIGDGKWIIVDSCIDRDSGTPAALNYLASIGVDPAVAVRFIIATHWHDDHIGGMAELLATCTEAIFCPSAALTRMEFLANVTPYEKRMAITGGSGVTEIFNGINLLNGTGGTARQPIRAMKDRELATFPALSHGRSAIIKTLSPSDSEFDRFINSLTVLMPTVNETRRRAVDVQPNDISVVTWIEVGEIALLLGADLEQTNDPNRGWASIVSSPARPTGKAQIFKIPHHGSVNAHSVDVWSLMVKPGAFAAMTPYNRGRKKLPSPDDVKRIVDLTDNAYITADVQGRRSRRRTPMVERTIRESVGKIRTPEPVTGGIRFRNSGMANFCGWETRLFRPALQLSALYAA